MKSFSSKVSSRRPKPLYFVKYSTKIKFRIYLESAKNFVIYVNLLIPLHFPDTEE